MHAGEQMSLDFVRTVLLPITTPAIVRVGSPELRMAHPISERSHDLQIAALGRVCPPLTGLPCTNWKKRTGVELLGTMSERVARWLDLPGHQQRDCQLARGKPECGGIMDVDEIAAYVVANGLPPHVAATRGGQPPVDRGQSRE